MNYLKYGTKIINFLKYENQSNVCNLKWEIKITDFF